MLDAFWYPGQRRWAALGVEGPLPAPCPAHEDPGLLTLVCDDRPGLQCRRRDGAWVDIELGEGECALVVGRALAALTGGRVPACTHRVRPAEARRTSLVFEILPNEAATRGRAAAEQASAVAASDALANAKYQRAAGALAGWGSADDARGACVVM